MAAQRGYGGVFDGNALDSFMTTAALTSITQRIILISTIHVLYGPCTRCLAKWGPRWTTSLAGAGASMWSQGTARWSTRPSAGTASTTTAATNSPLNSSRWCSACGRPGQLLLQGESSWKLQGAFVSPKPRFGRPVLVNATGSDAGIEYAARYSDIVFITSPAGSDFASAIAALPAHTARIKAAARAQGREVRTLLNPMVISRETEQDTWAYHDAIVAAQDQRTPEGFNGFDSDAHAWKGRVGVDAPKRRAIGGNIEVIGTPSRWWSSSWP